MTVPAHLRTCFVTVAREVQLSREVLQGTTPQIQAWSAIWGLTRSGNSLTDRDSSSLESVGLAKAKVPPVPCPPPGSVRMSTLTRPKVPTTPLQFEIGNLPQAR